MVPQFDGWHTAVMRVRCGKELSIGEGLGGKCVVKIQTFFCILFLKI